MEKNLKIYRKMKKGWSEKIAGDQEKLKAYQMLYTLPSSFGANLLLGYFNILGKLLKSYVLIWIFLAGILCFYFIYKEKKRQKICFVLKEIEKEILKEWEEYPIKVSGLKKRMLYRIFLFFKEKLSATIN